MRKNDARMKRGTKLLKKMGRDGLLEGQKENYPDLYEMTVGHLFGDIWTRPHLSLRDRQLITIAAGVALARRPAITRIITARSTSASPGRN
jgi:4-carboxymuconolactone decarboxylase